MNKVITKITSNDQVWTFLVAMQIYFVLKLYRGTGYMQSYEIKSPP